MCHRKVNNYLKIFIIKNNNILKLNRTLTCILENFQEVDGLRVPKVL